MIRAFLALEIEASMRERIARLIAELRPRAAGLRWVNPEGIHVTLRFLGPSAPETLQAMAPRLRELAAACPRGAVRVGGLGLFPERGGPRVLWLGLGLCAEMLRLQEGCEQAAVAAGYEPEGRAFRPHLTLGRWRDRAPRPELPAADLGETRVDRLVLFRSELRRSGAVYTPLEEFPLGAAPARG